MVYIREGGKLIEFYSLIKVFFAVLFFSTGIDKVKDIKNSLQEIESYRIIPSFLIHIFLYIIIVLHFLLSAMLFFNINIEWGYIGCIFLLLIYTIAISVNLLRKREINCGCNGIIGDNKISWNLIWRNMVFIFILIFLYTKASLVTYDFYNIYYFIFLYILFFFISLIKEFYLIKKFLGDYK